MSQYILSRGAINPWVVNIFIRLSLLQIQWEDGRPSGVAETIDETKFFSVDRVGLRGLDLSVGVASPASLWLDLMSVALFS